MSSDNLGFILAKLLINMVSCNISGAEVALLGRAGNFVALSSWPAAREPLVEPLERLEPENFRESAVRRGRRASRAAWIGEIWVFPIHSIVDHVEIVAIDVVDAAGLPPARAAP